MQNFIIVTLIAALAFFLYLIQSGEIDANMFSVKNLQGKTEFSIEKVDSMSLRDSQNLLLLIKGNPYTIFNATGMDFAHIPKTEYYMKIYDIPLEAKDAVTATWLGVRYVFYVMEEYIDGSELDIIYRVYKTEYPTDSTEPVEYTQFKTIRGLDLQNSVEVTY